MRIVCGIGLAFSLCQSAAPAAESYNREVLQQAVLDSKVLAGQNYNIADKNGTPQIIAPLNSADFTTPTSDPRKNAIYNSKLKGVLMAKTIMDRDKNIANVAFDFRYGARWWQFEVHAGDISAFAAGSITKERLLDSIAVQTNDGAQAPAVRTTPSTGVLDLAHIQSYALPAQDFNLQERKNHLAVLQALCSRTDLPRNQLQFLVTEFGKEEALAQKHNYSQWISQFNKTTEYINQMTELANKQAKVSHQIRAVKRGAYERERETLRSEIDALNQGGQDVSRLSTKFSAIEDSLDSAPVEFTRSMIESLQGEINAIKNRR